MGGGGLVSVHVRVYGHTDSEVMHQNVIISDSILVKAINTMS